jgi:hypothetical protein
VFTAAAQPTEVPLCEAVSECELAKNLHIHTWEARHNKWNCKWGNGDNFINVCKSINISKFKNCIMFNSTTVVSTGYWHRKCKPSTAN